MYVFQIRLDCRVAEMNSNELFLKFALFLHDLWSLVRDFASSVTIYYLVGSYPSSKSQVAHYYVVAVLQYHRIIGIAKCLVKALTNLVIISAGTQQAINHTGGAAKGAQTT